MPKPMQLDQDPIRTLFFRYYFPALTSMLSITIHQVINGIILAQYAGKDAVAAVGIFGPVLTVLITVPLALMIGGGILIARNIGAKNFGYAQEVFQFNTTMVIVYGIAIAVIGSLAALPVTRLLVGNDGEIALSAHDYFFWGFLWLPFFFLRMIWGNAITNDGAPKVSRNASLLAVGINIMLDVLLIIVYPMGAEGASIATGVAIIFSNVYLFYYLRQDHRHLSLKQFRFTLRIKGVKDLLRFGIPSVVSELSFSMGLLIMNYSIVPFGAMAVSAFGIVNHLSFIFLRLFTAAMIAVLPIISFNLGANKPDRVNAVVRFSIAFTLVLGLFVTLCGFVFSDLLIHIFSGEVSDQFVRISSHALSFYFLLFLAAGPNYIVAAYLQSIGKSTLSIVINFTKGFGLIAVAMIVCQYFNLGLDAIWLLRGVAEVLTLMVIAGIFLLRRKNYDVQPQV
jgi:putative MATE family efflux protein